MGQTVWKAIPVPGTSCFHCSWTVWGLSKAYQLPHQTHIYTFTHLYAHPIYNRFNCLSPICGNSVLCDSACDGEHFPETVHLSRGGSLIVPKCDIVSKHSWSWFRRCVFLSLQDSPTATNLINTRGNSHTRVTQVFGDCLGLPWICFHHSQELYVCDLLALCCAPVASGCIGCRTMRVPQKPSAHSESRYPIAFSVTLSSQWTAHFSLLTTANPWPTSVTSCFRSFLGAILINYASNVAGFSALFTWGDRKKYLMNTSSILVPGMDQRG